jgi:hypothetical protein
MSKEDTGPRRAPLREIIFAASDDSARTRRPGIDRDTALAPNLSRSLLKER